MSQLHLYLPSSLKDSEAFPPALQAFFRYAGKQHWQTKALEPHEAPDQETGLFQLFGVGKHSQQYPIAAITALIDFPQQVENQNKIWMRADPVHLRADRRFLHIFDARFLAIQAEEAQSWLAQLNDFYVQENLLFSAPVPERWYVPLDSTADLVTFRLAQVAGDAIHDKMPQGAAGSVWRRRMNEIQMLLHDHPCNTQRAQNQQQAMNSLWFWGQGALADVSAPAEPLWQQVWADDALSRGLAQLSRSPCQPLPEKLDAALLTEQKHLFILANQSLEALADNWIAPAMAALRQKHVSQIYVYPGFGSRFSLTRWDLRCFWRKRTI
ncbi:hypothetical protein QUF61_05635 [Candidatus Venteria ishoeyi]|uniref:hypothetical protein n=1 Tax=Candidatus Venteria ishoeyi TaxID=1899563 RepID=UPI0025A5DFE7|nr:hypothetical protein [Candidatus Venteria ishoeyi]MDM8545954.1 hypothetical protein [Candidatus Venteria ishoeyi]